MSTTLMWFVIFFALLMTTLVFGQTVQWAEKEIRKPLFYWNYVGGKGAACAVADFYRPVLVLVNKKDAKKSKMLVRETVRFPSVHMQIAETDIPHLLGYPSEKNNLLFVPFTSEAIRTYAEQEKLFIKNERVQKFARRKFISATKGNFRWHFAEWIIAHKYLEIVFVLMALVAMVIMFVFLFLSR